jgi:F0F1-type ATP synthase membrane subunit b/b'
MFAALIKNVFAFIEGESAPWWNVPSFEVWRFVNLFIFIGLFIYILRRPVSEAMRARREGIRRDLMRAQEERNAALAKLAEVEARLARLDAEVASVREQTKKEAAEEGERIRISTEEETQKLRAQAQREIESAGKVARQELREFAAEQSVRLAEEIIRCDIKPEDDARLVSLRVEELGGVRH